MKKSLLPVALGIFGLGISEFVKMGILPFIVRDLGGQSVIFHVDFMITFVGYIVYKLKPTHAFSILTGRFSHHLLE